MDEMIFPNNYFKEEVRDSFRIEELMKRAWGAEIEVLEVIDKICKKYNLTWFADWGTLLGAVRHNGFIPWDDDIDIAMLRKDYMKLIEVLPKELPDGFSVAGIYAQDEYMANAGMVQHLRVIADDRYWSLPAYMNRFHGFPCFRIGIDIFPMDNIHPDPERENEIENLYFNTMSILTNWNSFLQSDNAAGSIQRLEKEYDTEFGWDELTSRKLWLASELLIASNPESHQVTNYLFKGVYLFEKEKNFVFSREAFEEIRKLPFEFFEMPVPRGYDEVLTVEFGDYMTPRQIYDTHNYPFYKKQLGALEKLLKESGITCSVSEFCRNWMAANNIN